MSTSMSTAEHLSLSLQITRFEGAGLHRAALPRIKVLRWLAAALKARC